MALQLSYWADISGRAGPVRYLLKFAGVEFTEKHYNMNNMAKWVCEDKVELSAVQPHINLPFLKFEDGSILSCTPAIMSYIARNYDLQGDKSEKTLQRIDMLNDVLTDISKSFFETVCQKPKDHKDVLAWRQTSDFKFFGQLEKSLEMFDSKYLVGDSITCVDVLFFGNMSLYKRWCPSILEKHPKLEAVYCKLMENERLNAHFQIENVMPLTVQYRKMAGMQVESSAKNPVVQMIVKSDLPELFWGPEGINEPRC